MTPREHALLLRLAACELRHEVRGIVVLRRILRDLGYTDSALDAAVMRIGAALTGIAMTQETIAWEKAA